MVGIVPELRQDVHDSVGQALRVETALLCGDVFDHAAGVLIESLAAYHTSLMRCSFSFGNLETALAGGDLLPHAQAAVLRREVAVQRLGGSLICVKDPCTLLEGHLLGKVVNRGEVHGRELVLETLQDGASHRLRVAAGVLAPPDGAPLAVGVRREGASFDMLMPIVSAVHREVLLDRVGGRQDAGHLPHGHA